MKLLTFRYNEIQEKCGFFSNGMGITSLKSGHLINSAEFISLVT